VSDPVAILDGVSADVVPGSSRLAGIVTAGELLAAGLSWPRLRSLVRRGVLVPVGWGVYARAGPAAEATCTVAPSGRLMVRPGLSAALTRRRFMRASVSIGTP